MAEVAGADEGFVLALPSRHHDLRGRLHRNVGVGESYESNPLRQFRF
ncbi:MAG: hypothetical protein HYT87_11080 [Nitrospirae bacterium]|nr:hypothetical protein [Nitrospirota bacterium]